MFIHHMKRWSFLYLALISFIILSWGYLCGFFVHTKNIAINIIMLLTILYMTILIILKEKKYKSEIIMSNVSANKLLANLSHEFRTPMIGIIGAAELLEREKLDPEQQTNVEIIKNSGLNLLNIIDNVLDINKLEIGEVKMNLQPLPLRKIIDSCAVEISPALKAKGLDFKMDIAKNACVIAMLDEAKLRQILVNLLNKAIECAINGTIMLSVCLENDNDANDHLFISVVFTGSHEQIFYDYPLTSMDNALPADQFSTGLGLFFCRKLTEFMGGQFLATSNSEKCTVFQLILPVKIVSIDQIEEAGAVSCKTSSLAPFSRIKVLLVEDNNFNIKILSQMLYNYGFDVTTANNGLESLQKLQEDTFDVILMDMQMPIMDGYEASQIISSDPNYKSIPIIAVTANAMIGDREKCLACGCTSYLAKPFQSRELTHEIEQVLKTKKEYKKGVNSKNNKTCLMTDSFEALGKSINNLDEAYKRSDWDSIITICHDIKKIAGAYSFKNVYHNASLVETAAKNKTVKIIKLALIELNNSYKDLIQNSTLVRTTI